MSLRINGAPSKLRLEKITVNTTAVQIAPSRPGRSEMILYGSGAVKYGADDTVTAATGVSITDNVPLRTASELWGIAASGGPYEVNVIEIYDQE